MPNTYFQFKQFTVYQDRCAMKVCTDACVQGAFTARYLADKGLGAGGRLLDIGAGTGLLSLLLAQQVAADITAVELDAAAYEQASANFAAAPWADRMVVNHGDIRDWEGGTPFDFIITNPPFYEADLKSQDQLRNQAMHATTLSYEQLLAAIDRLLAADGAFSILLPYRYFSTFQQLAAASDLHLTTALHVSQRTGKAYFRSIGIFSRQRQEADIRTMDIYQEASSYTPAFITLLKDYYLYL
ncbi:methyltransferase [Chitinophaga pendula]|uniref:tRNA1(Val) (adenine(37)-N6)-methyltransferase n=1 Tax=Chitinophaga TaxID=79328 RepID=UPI000BAEF9F6|nr:MULTISPECIES: methyltransferase [Chitinophaga]ASZ13321.1 methyltransferase [Chitinophaga sp. MD30]UCJ09054.1 methyltransferase [Chitinophaga pendula]